MKVMIDVQKRKVLKKDMIAFRTFFYYICIFFALFYLCFNFLTFIVYKKNITVELYVGFFILFFGLFIIISNIFYINQVFRRDYSNEPTIIDYSIYKDYILIHNISINKKTKIYKKTVKHIFYKKNCAIVLTKDRHMYMIPCEVNIDILKKDTNLF